MLRGEQQNELITPRWGYPQIRNYRYVEQVFNVPLWYIETLTSERSEESERLWNRYIASSPCAALDVLQAHSPSRVVIHILLPGYFVQQDSPILTRCHKLWRCRVTQTKTQEAISFVTDHGEFVDYQDAVELYELEKVELVWQEIHSDS